MKNIFYILRGFYRWLFTTAAERKRINEIMARTSDDKLEDVTILTGDAARAFKKAVPFTQRLRQNQAVKNKHLKK